jgi:hypothetical protein
MTYQCILKQGLLSTVSILLLGACASDPSACDPRKGGFIAGLSAMGSGCYEKRVEEKQEKLSSAQSLTERLQGEQKMLRHEKGSTARQKSQVQGSASRTSHVVKPTGSKRTKNPEVARKEQELRAIRAKIAQKKKSQQGDSEEVKRLQQELDMATKERDKMARDAATSVDLP